MKNVICYFDRPVKILYLKTFIAIFKNRISDQKLI